MEVNVGASDVEDLVFSLSMPPEITGTVRTDGEGPGDSPPQPNAAQMKRPFSVTLLNQEEDDLISAQANVDGRFKIENVRSSVYHISVDPLAPGEYVTSIQFGGQDLIRMPLDLSLGVGGALDISISSKAAELKVILNDPSIVPSAGVSVTIWPKNPRAYDPLRGRLFKTSQDGTVQIVSIPPGEYYVAAWEESESTPIFYPAFLSHFIEDAALITLREGDKASVDVKMIRQNKIVSEMSQLH